MIKKWLVDKYGSSFLNLYFMNYYHYVKRIWTRLKMELTIMAFLYNFPAHYFFVSINILYSLCQFS